MKVVGKYIDAGISARKRYTKRPEILRLLDDVRANKIGSVNMFVGDWKEIYLSLNKENRRVF